MEKYKSIENLIENYCTFSVKINLKSSICITHKVYYQFSNLPPAIFGIKLNLVYYFLVF